MGFIEENYNLIKLKASKKWYDKFSKIEDDSHIGGSFMRMKVSEVVENIARYKEDASLYKAYFNKASGENAERLHKKYLEIIAMLDRVERAFDECVTDITEEDFKC